MFGALACYQTRLLATPISYRCRLDNNKNNWWNPMLNGRCFFLFTVATEVNWAFTKPGIPDARANWRWTDGRWVGGNSLWDNIPCCALWKTQYIFSRSKMVERPGGSTSKPESKQMNVPIHSAVGLCSWTIVGVDSKQFRRIVCNQNNHFVVESCACLGDPGSCLTYFHSRNHDELLFGTPCLLSYLDDHPSNEFVGSQLAEPYVPRTLICLFLQQLLSNHDAARANPWLAVNKSSKF